MNKKDMYLDFNQDKKRGRKNKNGEFSFYKERKGGYGWKILLVFVLAVVLGYGGYAISKMNLTQTRQEQPQPTLPSVQENVAQTTVTTVPTGLVTPSPVPTNAPVEKSYPDGFMSDFVDERTPVKAKGIYVNTKYLGRKGYATIDDLIELCEKTELNAMVIDVKDDTGNIMFKVSNELAQEIGATTVQIPDIEEFVRKLKEKDIYLIARVVVFKDMVLTKAKPDYAIKNPNGTIFRESNGDCWLNPYDERVWEYVVDIAKAAVEAGFDEINFDYLRTSSASAMDYADFGDIPEGMTRIDAVTEFVKYACEELKPMGAYVSGDVFATIINSVSDGERIGQSYVRLCQYLDYICPMTYPSHYSFGYAGLRYPDMYPFDILLMEMKSSVRRLSVIPNTQYKAVVRPWLQDFTASYLGNGRYIPYEAEEIRAQISAVYSVGYEEWLLWNAGMFYTEEAMLEQREP